MKSFAPKIAAKFGMNASALEKLLWGKYYYIPSEKKVVKKAPSTSSHEMFVAYIMNPLVQQYRNVFEIEKLSNTTELKKCHLQIKDTLYKWIPLERALLQTVIESLPSPEEAQKVKVNKLSVEFARNTQQYLDLKKHISACTQSDPIVVFVTKM